MRLIEKVWFQSHPAKWLLVPLLLPFTVLFYLLSALRRIAFRLGVFKTHKIQKPVIVVGNIGVGGNGKTPVVLYLVELCRQLGLTPGVISRGYGGVVSIKPLVLTPESTAKEVGDEPLLIYQKTQVPLAVGQNRVASAKLLVALGCDIIIADDGLQHYALGRDLELIVVDASRFFGNGLLLPAGPLREGQWRLKTANFVILNGRDSVDLSTTENDKVRTTTKAKAKAIGMQLKATHVRNILSDEVVAIEAFKKLLVTQHEQGFSQGNSQEQPQINAIAGIAAPTRFFNTLLEHQFCIATQKEFIDHHEFKAGDLQQFNDKLPLLMTEKDAVKCRPFAKTHWWYLPVEAILEAKGEEKLIYSIIKLTSEA